MLNSMSKVWFMAGCSEEFARIRIKADNFGEVPRRSLLPSFDKSTAKPRPRKAVSFQEPRMM